MVHIETVDLGVRGVSFPADRVGMVIAQPFVSASDLTATEPFKLIGQGRGRQLSIVDRTLALSLAANHGLSKTHFTVLPEYSVPGLDGIQRVDDALRASGWPNGTVVIGGCDALTHAEYEQLLATPGTHVAQHNGLHVVRPEQWLNCAIIWVKGEAGTVERWVQPKIHPAHEELDSAHQQMFRGCSVFMFKGVLDNGAPFRFATFVCFDWIATVDQLRPSQWLLQALQEQANGNQLPLSWAFVIQRNLKPSHATFLTAVQQFFNQTEFPNALRDKTCLVFANTAGAANPSNVRAFGGTSLVLSGQTLFTKPTCPPTYSNGGELFRDGSPLLNGHRDVYFRERGACIHVFSQVNAASLVAGPAGRTFPVEGASVFPIADYSDPRAPGGPVPAIVKWLNDQLDGVQGVGDIHASARLAGAARAAHEALVAELRLAKSHAATDAIHLAAPELTGSHCDDWQRAEADALEHLVHVVTLLAIPFSDRSLELSPVHASIDIGPTPVDVVAIRGATHEECIKHAEARVFNRRRHVLLVSRDRDNMPWDKRFGSFLKTTSPAPEKERKITEPDAFTLQIGYQNLLQLYSRAATPEEFKISMGAELAA